jgi:hypothetical protein
MLKLDEVKEPNCVKEIRVGKFRILHKFIEEHPEVVQAIMAKCIVVRAEEHFISNSIEYYAYSNEFDPKEDICFTPDEYDIEVNADWKRKEFKITFKNIEKNSKEFKYAQPLRTITYGDDNEKVNLSPATSTIDVGVR